MTLLDYSLRHCSRFAFISGFSKFDPPDQISRQKPRDKSTDINLDISSPCSDHMDDDVHVSLIMIGRLVQIVRGVTARSLCRTLCRAWSNTKGEVTS